MELKKVYTPEELTELIEWMNQHLPQMPMELEIHPGMTTNNLPNVVRNYIDLTHTHANNPTYGGQISHLFRIREVLIEKGLA